MTIEFEKMKSIAFLILTIFFVFSGCKKSESTPDSDLIIKAGFACGWGSGEDSLEISKTTIKYVFYIPARSNKPVIDKSRAVSESEWKEILNNINFDDFVKLNYQSCNICVDGCDEWISIRDIKISHEIRFAKGLKIDSISKLQNKLEQLRSEFNK
jgi:hypothetical protein